LLTAFGEKEKHDDQNEDKNGDGGGFLVHRALLLRALCDRLPSHRGDMLENLLASEMLTPRSSIKSVSVFVSVR
jgi:hypothetical protein